MFPDLPSWVRELQDPQAIALLQQLQHQSIRVSEVEIETTYIHTEQKTVPIVLLPGFDSSLLEFRRLFPLLATQHDTWAIDLLGFGFTHAKSSINITPRSIRQHLLNIVQAWINQPIILVGASLGGAVAIDFTLHHPEWVHSLVLIDSVGFSGGFPIGQWLPRSVLEWGADWLQFRKQAALQAALAISDRKLVDAVRCSLLHQSMPGWKSSIASFSRSGGYLDLNDRIAQIQSPTLIVWGKHDDVLGIEDATRFQQAIVNCELIWAETSGHVPHFDQPDFVASQLLRFVQQ